MSNDPLANHIFNKIESNLFHVSRENAQEIFSKLDAVETRVAQLEKLMYKESNVIADKIDNKIDDVMGAAETRIKQLEQLMLRGHQGVVAQVAAEMHHMHAQLEAKLDRQTWLLRVIFALVNVILIGMQFIWMQGWMQGENKTTCLRPLVAHGRLHCQVIDDGPSDVEHIADGMKALWNYTQHFNYSEWVTKFNTPP
jgi:hypothetical protein